MMSKIGRYEFTGNWSLFWVLCIFGITIPFAIINLMNRTIRLDSEVADPEKFVEEFRAGRLTARQAS